jgi:glycosyltransferase involved in cell wall biosynthesis
MNADTKNSPLVTIAIPTFNRAAYLVGAIESALAQTYDNIEVLISDNSSTDDTQSVIRSSLRADTRVRSLTQTSNLGMVGNWNACWKRPEVSSSCYFQMTISLRRMPSNCWYAG